MGRHIRVLGLLAAVGLSGADASPAAATVTFTEFRLTSAIPGTLSVTEIHVYEGSVNQATPGPAPIPEPAGWTLLITGFALTGGAIRCRVRPARGCR